MKQPLSCENFSERKRNIYIMIKCKRVANNGFRKFIYMVELLNNNLSYNTQDDKNFEKNYHSEIIKIFQGFFFFRGRTNYSSS